MNSQLGLKTSLSTNQLGKKWHCPVFEIQIWKVRKSTNQQENALYEFLALSKNFIINSSTWKKNGTVLFLKFKAGK